MKSLINSDYKKIQGEIMNFHFECVECKNKYPSSPFIYVCPECAKKQKKGDKTRGVLKVIIETEKEKVKKIFENRNKKRDFYKYLPLLPVQNPLHISKLSVGDSQIYEYPENEVFLFDDTRNPSCSYKDRASILVAAKALDYQKHTIVAASTGNAASSMACISASIKKLNCILCVPEKAPRAKIIQMQMFGADVVKVKGSYDDAFDLSLEMSEEFGYFNRNTGFNPFTIEGKKTSAFEMYDYFGKNIPDYIFVPTGDGVIISGIFKGFEDLISFGLIDKMPVIVCCQAKGSSVISNAFFNDGKIINQPEASTVADSINVGVPRNSIMAVDYLMKYNGDAVVVDDEFILKCSKELSSQTGVFAEPAGACAFAGFKKFKNEGRLAGKRAIAVITGNGLKDIESVSEVSGDCLITAPGIKDYKDAISKRN
ncbi:MAG: threonine synthase [Candidatus Muiribacteriota bacterium]